MKGMFFLFIQEITFYFTSIYNTICRLANYNIYALYCNVYASLVAKPETPLVVDDEIILEENDTYTLECTAMAGIPVADLRWYYKVPGSDNFVRIDMESKQEIVKLDECRQKAIQRLYIQGCMYRFLLE
jgi:hypothetical protein